ncbi:hypothetical protein ECANGB1_1353 [Enterospora canceri]|uniref:Uncharacterized protein n=1 Tax=Enterospora canceri TaxID=1081671 RepID=A0A1Y1S7G3_9MICR|nr:hypothetical protein ECANGB1_1353 [Enterospora canceri]
MAANLILFICMPMPEIIAIVLDNGIQSQNQDYLPSRYFIQKDATMNIINKVFEMGKESKIGVFPIFQNVKNRIVTPTENKQLLVDFVLACDLYKKPGHSLALYQADQALQLSELSNKRLLIFLSSKIDEFGKLLVEISTIAFKGVEIKVICFADAIEFGKMAQSELQLETVKFLVLDGNGDVEDQIYGFLTETEYEDEDLKEALQKSMFEK